MSDKHSTHRLLKAAALAGAAWAYAVSPRPPFLRRLESASLTPSSAQKDPAPLVPDTPFAHRGLHDAGSGYPQTGEDDGLSHEADTYRILARNLARDAGYGAGAPPAAAIAPENTLPAFEAACRAGYGIELDLQLTADGQVVVFHDDTLARAAGLSASIADLTYDELCRIPLFAGEDMSGTAGYTGKPKAADDAPVSAADTDLQPWQQHAPLFADVLGLVDARVPLIVEYKAQGRRVKKELLEKGDRLLQAYQGPYVVESFDPLAMGWYRLYRPRVLRGQLADRQELSLLVPGAPSMATRAVDALGGAALADVVSRPDFVAMDWHMWDSATLAVAGDMGAQRVAWTVRSAQEALQCVDRFDRIIFEGFIPQWGVFGRSQRNA